MEQRPAVTITMAQSIDGRLATSTGSSQWISGEETLALAQELRRDHESIMVGIGTVIADNPRLTCRLPHTRSPLRIVVDTTLRTPVDANVVQTADTYPTIIYVAPGIPDHERQRYERLGVEVAEAPKELNGGIAVGAILADLYRRGIRSTLVEGGSGIITSILKDRLADRLVVVMAPMVIGNGISSVGDLGTRALSDAIRGRTVSVRQRGEDIVWEVELNHG